MGLEGRRYDLIIRGGRVLDPAQGIDGIRDVAIAAGKVEAVEASIAPGSGTRVVDATGRLVTPGLIDLHAHLYYGATYLGIEPDAVCGPTGVTTVVDAGSAGANTFAGLRHFVVERSRTRVLPFLHVSSIGLATDLECRNLELVDVEKAVRCVEANRDLIGGIKVRANKMGVGDQSVFPVHLARDVADVTGLPLMVDMYYPPPAWSRCSRCCGRATSQPTCTRASTVGCCATATPSSGRGRWRRAIVASSSTSATAPAASPGRWRDRPSTWASGRTPSPPTCTKAA